MQKQEASESSTLNLKQATKSRQKLKDLGGKSKDFQTICLNQSELKHMHAIRPFRSKQRKSERKDSRAAQSPHQLSRQKSKRLEGSGRKNEEPSLLLGGKPLADMYGELISLKAQYKLLKNSYNKLLLDKKESTGRLQRSVSSLKQQYQTVNTEKDRLIRVNVLLEKELQRIKNECYKVVEMDRFKIKKLEQTIQEKELMIAYLRNQLDKLKGVQSQPNNMFIQSSMPVINFDYFSKPINLSNLSRISNPHQLETCKTNKGEVIVQDDSLSFSRDKSKEDSIIHSFLTHDQSVITHNFIKKQNILISSLQESPIPQEIEIIDEMSEKQSNIQSQLSSQPNRKGKHEECCQSNKETFSFERKTGSKGKINTKRLHISVNDENIDSANLIEQITQQTKKKNLGTGFACRQKKKLTAKKVKQP